jgi:membrane fusion protein (multidrug efflux system)
MAESLEERRQPSVGEHSPLPEPVRRDTSRAHKTRTRVLWIFTGSLLLGGLLWLVYWHLYLQYYVSTDDAYAKGNLVNVNSAINGSVVAFFADDTDLVLEGRPLVLLDRTDYQVNFEKELSALAAVVLQVRQLYDTVLASRATVENKKALLAKAQFDYENRSHLVKSEAISTEDFVHAKDDLLIAQLDLKQAEYQLEVALAAVGSTPIEKHPLIEQQKSRVRTAFYHLKPGTIYAPTTGFIAQRSVNVGQWATPNINLMAVIPTDYMWVEANFKETQLGRMRVGQPATVWFDLYGPHVNFEGKVVGIACGTGSIFSLIPPQNATGNWIKIVQRVPVRIGLNSEQIQKYPIRLGLSANVEVNVSQQDLPLLSQVPADKPIGTTRVFDHQLEEVNQVIQQVIKENLRNE